MAEPPAADTPAFSAEGYALEFAVTVDVWRGRMIRTRRRYNDDGSIDTLIIDDCDGKTDDDYDVYLWRLVIAVRMGGIELEFVVDEPHQNITATQWRCIAEGRFTAMQWWNDADGTIIRGADGYLELVRGLEDLRHTGLKKFRPRERRDDVSARFRVPLTAAGPPLLRAIEFVEANKEFAWLFDPELDQ